MQNNTNPYSDKAAELKPSTIATIAATATEGEPIYCQLERGNWRELLADLRQRLALRSLTLTSEGPGWHRVSLLAGAHQLPQAASCEVPGCLGRLAFGRCQRCGTRS